jgi:hypothetical protein
LDLFLALELFFSKKELKVRRERERRDDKSYLFCLLKSIITVSKVQNKIREEKIRNDAQSCSSLTGIKLCYWIQVSVIQILCIL